MWPVPVQMYSQDAGCHHEQQLSEAQQFQQFHQMQQQQPQPQQQQDTQVFLPVRTGASRRHRRMRMLQLKELQELEEFQEQHANMRSSWHDKKTKVSTAPGQWSQWRQEDSGKRFPPTSTRLSLALKAALECRTEDSLKDTEAPSSECASNFPSDMAAGTLDSLPSIVFPPTPESTPSNSPRHHFAVSSESGAMLQPFQSTVEFHIAATAFHSMPAQGVTSWTAKEKATRREDVPLCNEAECEALLQQLDVGDDEEKERALSAVMELAWPMAASTASCRVVQRALEVAAPSKQVAIAEQLKGRVLEASMCPHANHVLQKCVELLPSESLEFILVELSGHVETVARHRYGCRVLERLMERAWQIESVVNEVLVDANQLCRHPFGNFVVQHVLKLGTSIQKHSVVSTLHADIQRLARHRVASHVVRCALAHASSADKQCLVNVLTADAEDFADLAHHHCGSYVVRQLRKDVRR